MLKDFPKQFKDKEWMCNNNCKKDCCSDLFIVLTDALKDAYEKSGCLILNSKYLDFRWVALHKGITVQKPDAKTRKIIISDDINKKIVFNPHNNRHYLYIETSCSKIDKDGKCKIYRARPNICRFAKCTFSSVVPETHWFWESGIYGEKT